MSFVVTDLEALVDEGFGVGVRTRGSTYAAGECAALYIFPKRRRSNSSRHSPHFYVHASSPIVNTPHPPSTPALELARVHLHTQLDWA